MNPPSFELDTPWGCQGRMYLIDISVYVGGVVGYVTVRIFVRSPSPLITGMNVGVNSGGVTVENKKASPGLKAVTNCSI